LNDVDLVEAELKKGDVVVIIEPIQGVGGLIRARLNFFKPRKVYVKRMMLF
jgi:acetylornithine/succinyldiaminopimelate/putrescine aminotransferase